MSIDDQRLQEFYQKRQRFLSSLFCSGLSLTDLAIRAGFKSYVDYCRQVKLFQVYS
jgi:hypothetical protein